jgi:uncharacterized protein (DUF1800 family)
MDRRRILAGAAGRGDDAAEKATAPGIPDAANRSLPKLLRTTAGVEPYAGPWGPAQVAHLLRRTTFGAAWVDRAALGALSIDQAIDRLLDDSVPNTTLPLNAHPQDLVPVGQTWVNAIYRDTASTFNPTGSRMNSLRAWWIQQMILQQASVREKMVLFWHNHFVTEMPDVNDPRYTYRYVDLLRRNALGNFRTLARDMTLEAAMLIYLNGNTNTRTNPNENYARELQELFTIGKGPEVAPGDYTNYTEVDVRAAARVLTGWRTLQNADGTVGQVTWRFDATRHDTADKQFSHRYQNRVITGRSGDAGAQELDDLITMIFDQPETARYLCRKLYRWFVYYLIDEQVESTVITPMADLLRASNYDVKPVLRLLFRSAHFFDPVNMGCVIKSPLDLIVGMVREFGITIPAADLAQKETFLVYLVNQGSAMQQYLGQPPDVAGWSAYYQEPQYYELWINSDTLPRRTRLTTAMARNGYTTGGATMAIDPLAFALTLTRPDDVDLLIDDLCTALYPIPLTAGQKAFLKNTLLPGLPDYEWTVEWFDFVNDPTNQVKSTPVKTKLQTLLSTMLQMPEYQLQ